MIPPASHRLRILHLTASLYTGGAERLILGLTKTINRTEFDVHLCAIGHFGEDTMLRDFQRLDLPVHHIPIRRFYDPRILFALIRYVRSRQIDLIHTHLLYADILGRLVGQLLGIPVISTLQNDPADNRNERMDKRYLTWATARFAGTHLVAVSDQIRRRFVEEWQLTETRVSTIYNAVQMEPFLAISEPAPAGTPAGQSLIITTIGRLEPQKGQHLLLQAIRQLLDTLQGSSHIEPSGEEGVGVRLRIVGQGTLAEQLQAQAAALGITNVVEFTGLRRNIPQILADTDIFVLPSLWEGLPLSAIEAMAAARPVILTNVGGNCELLTDGNEGMLIPSDDVEALTAALLTLTQNPTMRQELGQRARAHARRHFHIDIIARQYEALYRTMHRQQTTTKRVPTGQAVTETYP